MNRTGGLRFFFFAPFLGKNYILFEVDIYHDCTNAHLKNSSDECSSYKHIKILLSSCPAYNQIQNKLKFIGIEKNLFKCIYKKTAIMLVAMNC